MNDLQIKLNKLETQELKDTGYTITNDGYCITCNSDNEYEVFKKIDFKSIELSED